MATDPFDSLRVRLTNHVAHRRSLGVLGLLGMANMALPEDAPAKKKRKGKKKNKKNRKKGQTTTPAPTTTSTTTREPGTCGAAGSICGTVQTPCICAASSTGVRCVSLRDFTEEECLDDSGCTDGKICIVNITQDATACAVLCSL